MPVILIPAQGAGVIVMPEIGELVAQVISNTSIPPDNFDCSGDGLIASGNTVPQQVTCYGMSDFNLNQAALFPQNNVFGSNANTYPSNMSGLVNSNIVFTFGGGDGPTQGNGSLRITFRYRILSGFNI